MQTESFVDRRATTDRDQETSICIESAWLKAFKMKCILLSMLLHTNDVLCESQVLVTVLCVSPGVLFHKVWYNYGSSECAKDGAYLKYFINCFTMWLIKTWPKLSMIWISYEYFERVGYNWSILLIHDPMAPKQSWSCTDWFSFGRVL
jgi:hypothetical protein